MVLLRAWLLEKATHGGGKPSQEGFSNPDAMTIGVTLSLPLHCYGVLPIA